MGVRVQRFRLFDLTFLTTSHSPHCYSAIFFFFYRSRKIFKTIGYWWFWYRKCSRNNFPILMATFFSPLNNVSRISSNNKLNVDKKISIKKRDRPIDQLLDDYFENAFFYFVKKNQHFFSLISSAGNVGHLN